ncbi:MAG TPA: tripartite tricarboxylate transporter TctB family protein [Bacillales bacterium]|nr:tripartite tricarboxylate transporter TctB family protein [Bacillales bacterium]
MNATKYMMPVFFLMIGVISFILSIRLPKATLGDPYGPLYFPILVSVFLFLASLVYLFNVFKADHGNKREMALLKEGRAPLLIISTLVLCVIYTVMFESLGYLVSTFLFLGVLLFIVNGKNKWITNVSVTILFTLGSWYAFTGLLDISLP